MSNAPAQPQQIIVPSPFLKAEYSLRPFYRSGGLFPEKPAAFDLWAVGEAELPEGGVVG